MKLIPEYPLSESKIPPTFRLSGSGQFRAFIVVGPFASVKDLDSYKPDVHAIWRIGALTSGRLPLGSVPPITYWRADPEDMSTLDGRDDRQRAELIGERLRHWKAMDERLRDQGVDMKVAILIASLVLSAASINHAQSWRVFSSPDKSLRIETPVQLNRIDDMYGDTSTDGYKAIDVFGGQSKSRGSFLIVILTPSEEMRSKHPNGNEIAGLEFMIGGDDAKPLSEKVINVQGLRGKEFIYSLDGKRSRGRILDACDRIFVLAYGSRKARDITSPSAKRFFESFQSSMRTRCP